MPPTDERIAALSQLNATERRILAMLGEGHTAKSIAGAMDISVYAVNERLRESRRKTGLSSSREIARALRAQENRDELIGVALPTDLSDVSGTDPRRRAEGRWSKGIIMGVIVASVLAAALAISSQNSAGADDPLLGNILVGEENQPGVLHAAVRAETPDLTWATSAETVLLARYGALSGIGHGRVLRVTCGSTLCEVAGTIDSGNQNLQALQELGLTGLKDAGFIGASFAVGHSSTYAGEAFVAYLRRNSVPGHPPR